MLIEQIPVEVIVKYSEAGTIRPLKIIYQEDIYVIDKIFNEQLKAPKGAFGTALEYNCLIRGNRRKLYFDRYNSRWFILKEYSPHLK